MSSGSGASSSACSCGSRVAHERPAGVIYFREMHGRWPTPREVANRVDLQPECVIRSAKAALAIQHQHGELRGLS